MLGLDKIRNWWHRRRPTVRRLIQLYSALLYNAHLKGFIRGNIYTGGVKALCVPGLNCYSCPAAVGACPLGALQNALSASGHRAGWYVFGILLLFGATLGRTVCGWLCPMGLFQELLYKIPTPKLRKGRLTRALSYLKYAVLAVFVLATPLWYGLRHNLSVPAFCKYICPAGTLEGAFGLLASPRNDSLFSMLGLLFTRKAVLLLAIGLACIFCFRVFCRFLCPLGALYGLFNRISLTGIRIDPGRCNGCSACVRSCGMDVLRPGDHECIQCAKCMSVCRQSAISMKCGKLTLVAPESDTRTAAPLRRRRTAAALALIILLLLLICLNAFPGRQSRESALIPEPTATEYASDAPIGAEIGQQPADFSVSLIGGGVFKLSEHRGQVVFINLWATYCGPCIQELPSFDRLRREHSDVAVLAVHSSLVTEDVETFLADRSWSIDFAIDSDDAILNAINGSALLPQTVVLNRRGEVVYNQAGSVTYEKLLALLEAAESDA